MASESPGRSELAELMAYHVFSDINRNELVPVVHSYGVAHEIRGDHAGA